MEPEQQQPEPTNEELMRISEAIEALKARGRPMTRQRLSAAIQRGFLRGYWRFGVLLVERAQIATWEADTARREAEHLEYLKRGEHLKNRKRKKRPQAQAAPERPRGRPQRQNVAMPEKPPRGRPRANHPVAPERNVQNVSPAKQFLLDMLKDGDKPSAEIRAQAEQQGIAQSSLYNHYRKMAEQRFVGKQVYWSLKEEYRGVSA